MRLLLLLLLFPGLAFGATSNVFTSARDTVRVVSASNAPVGGQVELGLQFQLAPGWHIYWSNPGDAGFAPAVLPAAPVTVSAPKFPPPRLLMQGPVAAYVLSGDVLLPFSAKGVSGAVSLAAQWLVCSDVCVPEHTNFTLALTGGRSAEAGLFAGAPQIVASPFAARLAPDGTLAVRGPSAVQISAAHFFPAGPGMIVNAAPQALGFGDAGLTLKLALVNGAKNISGVLELTDRSGAMQALAISPVAAAAVIGGGVPIGTYLLLAFLGGLILNLMPCVFPILALKALAICRMGGGDKVRREALAYTAGVLGSMLVLAGMLLALRAVGIAAGWGFQFQSPVFVALMAWMMFLLALNLAGVFEFSTPGFVGRVSSQHSAMTGMLAVVLATPCTAPFMGGAVAAALVAPVVSALGIFLALGLGMAVPFLAIALIPRLAERLPRPGAWMLKLQRILSLPMLATFVWLAWVLFHQAGAEGLLLLTLGALALGFAVTFKRLRPLGLAALLILPVLRTTASANTLTLPGALPYSPARLAALRAADRPVFIDLTAAWCVTCLVNETSTLKNTEVQSAFSAHDVALLVGDWTNRNADITALLAQNHRDGVPLYLYYAPGADAPKVLPQIFDPQIVTEEVR